jgi:predicted MPP superfamily phosphohydrolase
MASSEPKPEALKYSELGLALLGERLGRTLLQQRLHIQVHYASHIFGMHNHAIHVENSRFISQTLRLFLKCTGLYGVGNAKFKAIELRENKVELTGLPREFDGFRILHLSDLHLDLESTLTDIVIAQLDGLEYDICCITGDFRAETSGDFGAAVAETSKVVKEISTPIYAVLGNHDYIEMVLPLEEMGVRFLLNENVKLTRGTRSIYLAGIDDTFTYETEDFEKACRGIPAGATTILMSHCPDTFRRALASGFAFMMSGHTHGGQVCLPGGFALMRNARCPRRMIRGPWHYHEMQGYTSAGVGACNVPVRFFCPPEITIHTLRRSEGEAERELAVYEGAVPASAS